MSDTQQPSETGAPGAADGPARPTPAQRDNRKRRRAIRRWIKRGALIALAVAIAGAVVWAMLPKPVPVDIAEATRGPMSVAVREDGKSRVKRRYVLSAPLAGNMLRIDARPGDPVEAGQTLVRILPATPPLLDARTRAETEARLGAALASQRQARAQVAGARTAFEQARINAERQQALRQQGVVPESTAEQAEFARRAAAEELASAEFAVKVADHQAEQARATLGRLGGKAAGADTQLEVASPVSGAVLRVIQESETVVAAGTPLLEVGDPAALEVVADVLTRDAVHIRPGSHVEIDRWGGDAVLRARVSRVEPSAFTRVSALGVEEQRVNAVIDFDEPRERWQALGDGYRVEVRIELWSADDVLTVPASAVFRRGDEWAVFAVRDGVARLVSVEIGHRNENAVEITSGLAAGDRVVRHPSDRVADGVAVTARGG